MSDDTDKENTPDSDTGSTEEEDLRHWLTNDIAYLWVLAAYMTVWGIINIHPRLGSSCGTDAGAVLALGVALTWGFGPKAVQTWSKLKGGA